MADSSTETGCPKQKENYFADIDQFIQLLRSEDDEKCEKSLKALGNIADDSPENRDMVISRGVMEPLLKLINDKHTNQFLQNAACTLSILCQHPFLEVEAVEMALPSLAFLISFPENKIISDACWALSYLTNDSSDNKFIVADETDILSRLVQLLGNPNVTIIKPALRVIGNIVTTTDAVTQTVINNGALALLKNLLQHSKSEIVKEAAWVISNIAAGNNEQIQAIIDADLIPHIVHALDQYDLVVKREVMWIVYNYILCGSSEQITYIQQNNVIPPICKVLIDSDTASVNAALESINNILQNARRMDETGDAVDKVKLVIKECIGLDRINALRDSNDKDAQTMACEIIDEFF